MRAREPGFEKKKKKNVYNILIMTKLKVFQVFHTILASAILFKF